jgi:FkbM family methyltransferase
MLKRIASRIYRPLKKLFLIPPSETWKAVAVFRNAAWVIAVRYDLVGIMGPKEVSLRNGTRIIVTSTDDLTCVWSCWVREDYRLTGAESTIIDAGANIGAFTLYAASKCPNAKITSLEPVKATFDLLRENLRMNPARDRVQARRTGVFGKSDRLMINVGKKTPYSSVYANFEGEKEEIAVLGMSDLLAQGDHPASVDFLKMDCEGAEVDCLMRAEAASLRRIKKIHMEYHSFSGYPLEALTGKMAGAGFSIARLSDHKDGTCLVWFHRDDRVPA